MAMIAARTQCDLPSRYLCPERFRFINQAQYRTFGTAPASNSGNQIALIALSSLAPKERASATKGVPKATPKFMRDAARPHMIASSNPCEVVFWEEIGSPPDLSRNFPAAAQSIPPKRTKATA